MAENLELSADSIFISQWSLVAAADKENRLTMHHLTWHQKGSPFEKECSLGILTKDLTVEYDLLVNPSTLTTLK